MVIIFLLYFLELQNQIEHLEQSQQTGQDNNSINSSEKIRELEKTVKNLKREKEDVLKVNNKNHMMSYVGIIYCICLALPFFFLQEIDCK